MTATEKLIDRILALPPARVLACRDVWTVMQEPGFVFADLVPFTLAEADAAYQIARSRLMVRYPYPPLSGHIAARMVAPVPPPLAPIASADDDGPETLTAEVRAIFARSPSRWIDGHAFQVGGFAGWSARIRDLRKPPSGMAIVNKTTRRAGLTTTAYVWLPLATPADLTAAVKKRARAFTFTGRPLADWEAVKHG